MSLFVTGNRGALALIGGFTGDLSLAPTETFDSQDGTLLSAAWTALRGVTPKSCSQQNAFTSVAP